MVVTKMKEVSQIRLRLGKGRAVLRHKMKTPMPLPISKPYCASKGKTSRTTKSPCTQNF